MLNFHSSSVFDKKMSFSNPEVIITTYDDKRLIALNESSCRSEQEDCGPTYVVIRPNATDDQLNKISSRFNLAIDNLKFFRSNLAL